VPRDGCGDPSAAFLFQEAKVAIAAGYAGPIAEPLEDVEGKLVLAGRLLIIPPVLGKGA